MISLRRHLITAAIYTVLVTDPICCALHCILATQMMLFITAYLIFAYYSVVSSYSIIISDIQGLYIGSAIAYKRAATRKTASVVPVFKRHSWKMPF